MNKRIIMPDYSNCLTNVTCSILKYYNVPYQNKTLPSLDDELNIKYKNVVLLLYDGMGSKIIEKLPNSFLNKHKKKDILTVFPSTTTAATTSVLSGLNPVSHGWLGWDLYFKMVDKTVTMFTNCLKDSDTLVDKDNLAYKYYDYVNILERLKKQVNSYIVSPFCSKPYEDYSDMLNQLKELLILPDRKFIYAYYKEPDHSLHLNGTDSPLILDILKDMDKKTEELCNSVKDTLFIIVADHGHINSNPIYISDSYEFYNMLERTTSIEPRACNFFIKEGKKEEFVNYFNNHFENDFLLFSKDEVVKNKLFGEGINHQYFLSSLGDYLAVAINDKHFLYNHDCNNMKSMHGGITEDEMLIPLIIIRR